MQSAFPKPSSFLSSMQIFPTFRKATTLFLIQHARSSSDLRSITSDCEDEILHDSVCLAHVRLVASSFMLREIYHCIQRMEARAMSLRLEATYLLTYAKNSRFILPILRQSAYVHAQTLQDKVGVIKLVVNSFYQFIGMHIETLDDVRRALKAQDHSKLARAIVTSCRQASSFAHAVLDCKRAVDVYRKVSEAVRTSLGNGGRWERGNNRSIAQVAGQLGQFWNQGSVTTTSSSSGSLSSHDTGLTLQILQAELDALPQLRRSLYKAVDKDLAPAWDIQRRPIRYALLFVTGSFVTKTLYLHAGFLGGSGLVERRILQGMVVTRSFFTKNVYKPVSAFYSQVFGGEVDSGSEDSVALARSTLREMLIDFTERNLSHVEGAMEHAREGSMKAVMDIFVEQAANPIRNSVVGSLGPAILLQVQKLKVDVEELMMKSKQTLKAQELNLALVALVPSLIVAASLTYMCTMGVFLWRTRQMEVIVSGSQTARFLLGDVHDALISVAPVTDVLEEDNLTRIERVLQHVKAVGKLHSKIFDLEEVVFGGIVDMAPKVKIRFTDDTHLLKDWSISYENRRRYAERMLACYPFMHKE